MKVNSDIAVQCGLAREVPANGTFAVQAETPDSAITKLNEIFDLSGVKDLECKVEDLKIEAFQLGGTHWAWHRK
jgi:hypothetical protein